METARHIRAISEEGRAFARAAGQLDFDTPIQSCPGWTMRDLVRHLIEIHLWAAAHVSMRATKMWVDDLTDLSAYWPDLATFWPEDGDLVDHYVVTNQNLVRELESAPTDVTAMTFLPAPTPLAMWARRQAHETSIHRFDAQSAGGAVSEFDPHLASDGIDEILAAFAPRAGTFPIDQTRVMAVHAIDTGDRWRVTMSPDGVTTERGSGPADAVLVGRATDLYLAVWNRGDDSSIEISGDRGLVDTWHEGHRIRWS